MLKRGWIALVLGGTLLAIAVPAGAQAATQALVNTGSPATPFPQNKQNEPSVAIDPIDPSVAVAGSNDEIDEPKCGGPAGNQCPFAQGIGNSGVYFSFDGGTSWTQPTYQGFTGRTGTGFGVSGCNGCGAGPIGTLPHYSENGLVSDGDPVVAFGPTPDSNGNFSWSNGSRVYYANLTSNFNTRRKDFTFKGFEAIAVSHADDVAAAASDDAGAWSDPSIVTAQNQSSATFSDKEALAVDDASSSPHFGNAYVCYSRFQSAGSEPVAIHVTRSTDGGDTWAKPQRLTASFNSKAQPGRQGCAVATDSNGVVYLVWEDTLNHHSVFLMSRSFDGGVTFEMKPRVVAHVTDVGKFDGVRSISFDGIAGARTSSFPSLSIANGTPTGSGAPNTLALGWSDGSAGLNHEHALVQLSGNRGNTWTSPQAVEQSGDRPDFAFLGISPNGSDLYVVYDGFSDPFRNNTTDARQFEGVLRHADVSGTALSNLTTLDRGAAGDGRASSANALIDEFIGDYNTVDATNRGALAVFNDANNAALCPAINTFRQAVVDGTAGAAPAPGTACPATFGNTDIISSAAADPTP
jgi:hypothetical protein